MVATLDPVHFRQVLGQYPTGVAVVTAMSATGEPLGMTVGSFTSVSLDPPLVAFLPDKKSSSWRALQESGNRFCVNVLGADQETVCRAIAVRKTDKFEGIEWRPSPGGHPVVAGSVAYIDCTVEQIHDAGDHHIVVGRVDHLDVENTAYPLLFFRGGYGSFVPLSLAAGDADLLDQLRLVDLARRPMDELAAELDTEVTAITPVRDQLVLAAASGRTVTAVAPTRVGVRVPFMPPLGSVFAAYGGDEVFGRWLAQLDPSTPDAQVEEYRRAVERVRARGFAVNIGHRTSARVESLSARLAAGDPEVSSATVREAIRDVASGYNPELLAAEAVYELRALSAPVFHPGGQVAFTLTLWGPPGEVSGAEIGRRAARLLETTAAASAALERVPALVQAR